MNSSGIKRGLATTAVTALAVAGLPLIASSASAAEGSTLSVLSQAPIRNGNAAGGAIIFKSDANDLATDGIYVTNASYGSPKMITDDKEIVGTAFDVDVKSFQILDGDEDEDGVQKFADGSYHYRAVVAVTLGSASKASFGIVSDADGSESVSAADPKTVVEVTPTGAPASVEVTPDERTTATEVPSADYTVTVKDSAGNTTQLMGEEAFTAAAEGVDIVGALNVGTMADGVATFTATSEEGGSYTIKVAGNGTGATKTTISDTAKLTVLDRATITEDEFDIETGADTWDEDSEFGDDVAVRVGESTVTLKFMSADSDDEDSKPDDAGKVVLVTVTGQGNVKFGGKATQTYSVVLGADGTGELKLNPTGVVANSTFTFAAPESGIESTQVQFQRATASMAKSDAKVYVTEVGGNTEVTVTVVDQFGNPVGAPAQVQLTRSDREENEGSTGRVTVDANGQATFTLDDEGTEPGTESFVINLFEDEFDGTPNTENEGEPFAGGTINYTEDGLGGEFSLTDLSEESIVPLTDTVADDENESVEVDIEDGTPNAPATVTVDNGALILTGDDEDLSKGSASKSITLDGDGEGSFMVVGTTVGDVTVTVESAGRQESETFEVEQDEDTVADTARNVELTGPEKAEAGSVVTYVATVTDAFGNAVEGFTADGLAFSVSGPGNTQTAEAETDENGEFEQTVLLTDNASSDITVTVKATGGQFGSKADEIDGDAAKGLTASQSTDSVVSDVVNIEELEQAVEDAEEALEEAQEDLAIAQGNLDVATTELAVAQANVDSLTAKKQALRQKLNKAKAKGNKQKAKTTRKKLRNVKRNLRAAEDNLTVAMAKVDAAQAIVEIREGKVADAEADLAEAQQNLEDAQNG